MKKNRPLPVRPSGAQGVPSSRMVEARSAYSRNLPDQAAAICAEVLKAAPDTVEALHMLGVIEARRRNPAEAEALLARAAGLAPRMAGIWVNLANLLGEQGRYDEALVRYDHVVALGPVDEAVLLNRAGALKQLGRLDEAMTAIDAAIEAFPVSPQARFHRGWLLKSLGRPEAALSDHDRGLALWADAGGALTPELVHVHTSRGLCLHEMARPEESLAAFRAALDVAPNDLDSLNNCAVILIELNRAEEALAYADRAVAAHPDAWAAHGQRGSVLGVLNRREAAVACYDRALADHPDNVTSLVNRGTELRKLQRNRAALADFQRVLDLVPFHRQALNNRASLLRDLGRNNEAAETCRLLRQHHPDHLRAEGNRLNASLMSCAWGDLDTLDASITADIRAGVAADTPFSFLAYSTSPEDQLACASAWIGEKHRPVSPAVWTGERYRHDRIRLAYLSSDFQNHPMAYLMGKLFETHDRDRFDVTAISFGRNTGDPMRKRLEAAFDRFVDMESRSDRETATLVRELEIDIAIDRKGFTRDARTGIFAMRPAPVQVNYLAYPGTMGAPYMDYLIADPVIIPEGDERFYSEKVVRLPDTYQATDDQRPIGETPSRADCNLPATGFVFCSFNNNYKILPQMFDIWMRLLTRVEGSVLWLYVKSEEAIENLRREAAARGVDPDRLVFATHLGMSEHLARHRQADLFLDTFPYTSHTTASDALWAGLPVVTCAGRTFTSRVAASLLSAVGLPELITTDFADYEALALKLALEPDRLTAVKAKLAERRTRWPLFDSDRFRLHLESAFVTMHERQQQGLAPEAFAVQPISGAP